MLAFGGALHGWPLLGPFFFLNKGLWPNRLLFMAAGISCVGQSNMTQFYMEVVDMDFLNLAPSMTLHK